MWGTVWGHCPTDRKDDELLSRELNSPRWRLITDTLERHFGHGKVLRTIELGSGRGDWSALLADVGHDVSLLDAHAEALRQARRRFKRRSLSANFTQGDLFAPEAKPVERFDVAFSSGVIEHFRGAQRTRAIRCHAEWVRPGGLVVISVPHAQCPSYRTWKMYLEMRDCWPYGVEIPFSRSEIIRRSIDAGLVRVRAQCTGFWQSFADHLVRPATGHRLRWSNIRSIWDDRFGVNLVLVGLRPEFTNATPPRKP